MTNEEQVRRTKTAVEAVLAYARLQKELATYGYDKKKMLEGKARWEKVEMLIHLQKKEYGESYEATDSLNLAKADAWQVYVRHQEIARVALKDNRGAYKSLQLTGERKKDLFGWLAQARTFYANVEGVKETLTKYSLTEDELKQGQAMIEAVYQAHSTRRKEYSEAKQATQNRNQALEELTAWTSAFVGIAKVAFANDPEALELMGLLKTA